MRLLIVPRAYYILPELVSGLAMQENGLLYWNQNKNIVKSSNGTGDLMLWDRQGLLYKDGKRYTV
jgi:hypothetical protein